MSHIEHFIKMITMGVGLLVLGMMPLLIVLDVMMRNLFGSGFPAATELVSRYFIVIISFLPIAYAEVQRRHIEASIFVDFLPRSTKPFIYFIGFALSLLVYGALTWGTGLEAYKQMQIGSYIEAGTITFLVWPGYWVLPICYGLMVLVLAMRILQVATGRFKEEF